MLIWFYQVGPTWIWCGDDKALMSCPRKVICHKGSFYYV